MTRGIHSRHCVYIRVRLPRRVTPRCENDGNHYGTTFWSVVSALVKYEMEYAAEEVSVYKVCDGTTHVRAAER